MQSIADRTDRETVLLVGVGLAAVATIGLLAWGLSRADKPAPKRNYGIKVGPQCSSYEITDSTTITETISSLVDQSAAAGAVDPFAVTSAWLRGAAGQCRSFPDQARNPGEAQLYRDTFLQVIRVMLDKNLLSQEMHDTYAVMIDTWAQAQGVETGLAGA